MSYLVKRSLQARAKEKAIHSTWTYRRSRTSSSLPTATITTLLLVLLSMITIPAVNAGFITFDNCLNQNILNSQSPKQLQFVPLFVNAVFNTTDVKYNLNITVYGNVTGQSQEGEEYPPKDSLIWKNDTKGDFSIVDAPDNYTTLFASIDVLSYQAYNAKPARFCNSTIGGDCPWIPLWDANASNPVDLHAFSISHDFYSAYSFATFAASLSVSSGNNRALACIAANITPDLGQALSNVIRYIPATILVLVGFATVMAARFSPWSSKNIFYWTSNYGRDDDILRLVTPGFGDCLQYIQFIVLGGSLSLGYPGFYQPVVSQASWSVLMFNESFVSHGNGSQSLVDGIYRTNGTYGLTRLSQLAGMSTEEDVWAGMAIWVLIIMFSCLVLCQLGFAAQYLVRLYTRAPQEDLRNKNLPFTAGNFVRIVFNYFMSPIVALSMFQLVVATRSPSYVIALAAIVIVALILFAIWIFRLIFTTKPRVHLFDDEPLLLIYGPLYNTYSDEAAPYAFIPFLLTFIRGIAIGAVQPSGIAQLVILAICEVVLILTLHAFRPFRSLTSMNAYHTFFSSIRLVTVLLSVAFVPSLEVPETSKGWIGYAILLLHAIVLIFGFFLNSIQTLIEVFARLAGAGRETRGGLTTVFGMRQLSKRVRRDRVRGSMHSSATALTESKSMGHRASRSMSASSGMLLNAHSPDQPGNVHFEISQGETGSTLTLGTSPGPSTPGGAQTPFSFIPGANPRDQWGRRTGPVNRVIEPADPYYRPPRLRRRTLDALQDPPQALEESRRRSSQPLAAADADEGLSAFSPNRGSITAAFMRNFRDDPESQTGMPSRKYTDYSTRESDFYYGVRGPALSKTHGSRRLKTGPADPMSPIGSATGWFKGLFGGKSTSKKGGFEVVRSTPLHQLQEQEEELPRPSAEPYQDTAERGTADLDLPAAAGALQDLSRESISDELFHPGVGGTHLRQLSDVPSMIAPITSAASLHLSNHSTSVASSARYTPADASFHRNSSGEDSTIATLPSNRPGLDRVSSFRGPGNKDPEARVPFSSAQTQDNSNGHSTRGSMASSIYPASEEALDLNNEPRSIPTTGTVPKTTVYADNPYGYSAPTFNFIDEIERPLSTGRVAKHSAGEGIHYGIHPKDSRVLQGSAAELVDVREGRRDGRESGS